MKQLIITALLLAATFYGYKNFKTPAGAFDDSGRPLTLLFTFSGCGKPCDDAKQFLERRSISYKHQSVDTDTASKEKLERLGGGRSFPILFVGDVRVDAFHRDRYREALAQGYGMEMIASSKRATYNRHFDSAGNPRLVMYGADWCPYCKKAREFFNSQGMEYIEWDVEKDADAARHYKNVVSSGYPLIYVGFERLEGFDPNVEKRLKELL